MRKTDKMDQRIPDTLHTWMQGYLDALISLFGPRLLFVGLQGSYGRGEATASSDIDVVVILDHVDSEDLKTYGFMLDSLPDRESQCGFISGQQELLYWERSELVQFYHDTVPIFGSIDFLLPLISEADIQRAVRIGACTIYHMCAHNMVHEKNSDIVKALYKSAAFTVQAVHYDQTGTYIKQKAELVSVLRSQEREILLTGNNIKKLPSMTDTEFERFSALLLDWAANIIVEYGIA